MTKNKNFLFNVGISNLSKKEILEEIKKWFQKKSGFYQIATINPEILALAQKDDCFRKVLNKAQISTADGIGIVLASEILGQPLKERVAGVDLMKLMVKMADDWGLTVGLIGGRGNVAVKTAECLKKEHPNLKIFGLEGTKNIKKITLTEKSSILSIIHGRKPQMLFVAFGAPHQEFFIDSLKNDLEPLIAMGVGGSFDEISGQVKKTPEWMDKMGLKWLWRLIQEPWRWKRQLALIEFIFLVFKQRLSEARK